VLKHLNSRAVAADQGGYFVWRSSISLIISQDHIVMCLSMVAAEGPWHLVPMIASSCNSSSNLEMELSKRSMQYDVYGVPCSPCVADGNQKATGLEKICGS
jgi:hypothetical protein